MIQQEVLKQESFPPVEVGSSNELSPSEGVLQELGEHLQKSLKRLKTLRENSDWEKQKSADFNSYHMKPKSRPLPFNGAANLSCPLPRIGVDSFHANEMASLFSDENKISIKPSVINREMANTAKKAAQYMTYVMNHECDTYMVVDDAGRKWNMFGVGYIEPYYEKEEIWETREVKETRRVPEINPITQSIELKEKTTVKKEKKKRVTFDGTKIRSIPVDSIYRDPFISFEEALRTDSIHKIFNVKYSFLKEKTKSKDGRPSFYKRSQVSKIAKYMVEKSIKIPTDLDSARSDLDGFWIDQAQLEEIIEMGEAYLWYDIDGDDIKEEIRVTYHPVSGTVIRVSFSKCRIVDFNPRPVDERAYGEGIPKILEELCNEWENFHNARSNAGQWENTTFGFYRAGGRFNPQQITISPGHFYPVDDPREVQFANVPRVGSSYFQEEQIIQSYFEKILALDENFQGVPSRRRQTATESMTTSQRASIRFSNPFNRIVSQFNKLLGHIWDLNRECAPDDKEFYVLGEDGSPLFEKMTRGDFSDKFKFSVEVQSVFDKQMQRDTWLLAYRLFIVNPYFQQYPDKLWEISQKTINSLSLDIDLPKPIQAKTTSPYEKIEIIKNGGDIEPELGEDHDHNLAVIEKQLQADDIKDWDDEEIRKLIILRDKILITKKTLESANLNQSGQFSGGPLSKQPPITASRNPAQKFNTMRVGEGQNSIRQNMRNGQQGQQNAQPNSLDQVTGSV